MSGGCVYRFSWGTALLLAQTSPKQPFSNGMLLKQETGSLRSVGLASYVVSISALNRETLLCSNWPLTLKKNAAPPFETHERPDQQPVIHLVLHVFDNDPMNLIRIQIIGAGQLIAHQ